jgi:hypothetical protein
MGEGFPEFTQLFDRDHSRKLPILDSEVLCH